MGNELVQSAFSGTEAFEVAQRMAKMLQESDLVPQQFKGSLPNCVIALEMSQRLGMNPLAIMQNIYVVHGKPAWSSQFLIACINGCGRFSPLRYDFTGTPGHDDRTCIAWAYDLANNERLDGPPVSIAMAKKEGWYQKNGSKWQTMPELMLRYRSATLFSRCFCPELTMGMHTQEEIKDIGEAVVVDTESLAPRKHKKGDTTEATTQTLTNAQIATEAVKRGPGRPRKKQPDPEPAPIEPDPEHQADSIDASFEVVDDPKESPVEPPCASYEQLEAIYKRTPAILKRACVEVGKNYGIEFKTFTEIDAHDEAICSEILTVAERLRAATKG